MLFIDYLEKYHIKTLGPFKNWDDAVAKVHALERQAQQEESRRGMVVLEVRRGEEDWEL